MVKGFELLNDLMATPSEGGLSQDIAGSNLLTWVVSSNAFVSIIGDGQWQRVS